MSSEYMARYRLSDGGWSSWTAFKDVTKALKEMQSHASRDFEILTLETFQKTAFEMGKRGGKKSKRVLTSEQARAMVASRRAKWQSIK